MKKQNIILGIMIAFAIIGIADTSYLIYHSYTATPINCMLFDGCNTVAKSPYSKMFGIPLNYLGFIYYVGILGFVLAFKKTQIVLLRQLLLAGTAVGFVMSLYFVYVQGFLIQAFCVYCLMSAVNSVVLFCSAIALNSIDTVPGEIKY